MLLLTVAGPWVELPAAVWPINGTSDGGGAWTGSVTVVNGVPQLMYPGMSPSWSKLPETMNIVVPANLSDPDYRVWTPSARNPIVQAGHDFTTAWRTEYGWRTTNVDGIIFNSGPDFVARPALLRTILGRFSSPLPKSNQTFCMLNRQRGLTLLRPTATPTATSSASI